MNCDNCHQVSMQTTHGPGIPEDEYWCDDCCRQRNVRVPSFRVWDGDRIHRERVAEAKLKHEQEIDRLRQEKGLDRYYSKEVA